MFFRFSEKRGAGMVEEAPHHVLVEMHESSRHIRQWISSLRSYSHFALDGFRYAPNAWRL